MSSRDAILNKVKVNQPATVGMPSISLPAHMATFDDVVSKYIEVLTGIGGRVIRVLPGEDLAATIKSVFNTDSIISVSEKVSFEPLPATVESEPVTLKELEVAVMDARFGVAENGAVWVTEEQYKVRALPFICQQLAVLLPQAAIVPHMHAAYELIGNARDFGFGVFIAGPSKTADIEQSLVLGAHGPKTMTIFLMP